MKKKTGFWMMMGIGIAAVVSISSGNLQAGLFIGSGTAVLLMIITNLETDRKKRN